MKILTKNQTKHGLHGTPAYKLWAGIVKRCECESSENYKYYGGSGISVCKEWRESPKTFCEWAIANGYEKGLSIDRIDNKGNYEPNNCRFVLHKENCAPDRRRVFSSNKTGHTGISKSKKSGKYEVYITINGKQTYIGCRETIEDAVLLKQKSITKLK